MEPEDEVLEYGDLKAYLKLFEQHYQFVPFPREEQELYRADVVHWKEQFALLSKSDEDQLLLERVEQALENLSSIKSDSYL